MWESNRAATARLLPPSCINYQQYQTHNYTHTNAYVKEVMTPQSVPPRSEMSETKQGWVQGSGAHKRSLDSRIALPPLWGVYNPRCKERGAPHGVIVVVVVVVVEYYLIASRIPPGLG